jgi:hypothetical protein
MHTMNRRMFLMGGAAASALLTGTRYLSADPLGLPIGCQTYPVRKSINTDFAGTMKGLRAAGFTQIELYSPYGYGDFSSLQQYKPQAASQIAIVIGGYGFAHGEPGAKKAACRPAGIGALRPLLRGIQRRIETSPHSPACP